MCERDTTACEQTRPPLQAFVDGLEGLSIGERIELFDAFMNTAGAGYAWATASEEEWENFSRLCPPVYLFPD